MIQLSDELKSKLFYAFDAWMKSAEKVNDAAIKWRDAGEGLKDVAREAKQSAEQVKNVASAALLVVNNIHGFAITGAVNDFSAYWRQKAKIERLEFEKTVSYKLNEVE